MSLLVLNRGVSMVRLCFSRRQIVEEHTVLISWAVGRHSLEELISVLALL